MSWRVHRNGIVLWRKREIGTLEKILNGTLSKPRGWKFKPRKDCGISEDVLANTKKDVMYLVGRRMLLLEQDAREAQ